MRQHLYATLIEDFCRLAGISSPIDVMQGATVETDGIRFSLAYAGRAHPDLLFIYGDFLDPTIGSEADWYRAVLTKNLFLYAPDAPVFARSPDTGCVVLAQHVPLAGSSAEALADKLIALAADIHELREEVVRAAGVPRDDAEPRRPTMRTSRLLV
jgi:hypothetical protein